MITLALGSLWACGSPDLKLCGEIPEGGCPIGRGGTCDDAYCAALYDCVDGDWTLSETCEGQGGSPATSSATTGVGGCDGVVIDRTGETEGCMPDLQSPDCPAEAAEVCPNPCLTGCVDFFLCRKEWVSVAYCDDLGEIVLVDE